MTNDELRVLCDSWLSDQRLEVDIECDKEIVKGCLSLLAELETTIDRKVKLEAEVGRIKKPYPIQNGSSVPWEVMAPHNAISLTNHSQTIERIAERGGFGPAEAYCIVNDLKWREMEETIGFKEAERLWLVYAERINLHYERSEELEAQLKIAQEALKSFALAHKVYRQDTETLRQFESGLNNGDLRRAKEVYEERG